MKIEDKLLKLRKEKGLSQEEVADRLNVSRQTISKWETGQSTPDFDKIIPICELYEISCDELLKSTEEEIKVELSNRDMYSKGIGLSIFLYCFTAFIILLLLTSDWNLLFVLGLFFLGFGISTGILVYTRMMYKNNKKNKLVNKLDSTLTLVILTFVSLILNVIVFTFNLYFEHDILNVIIGSDFFYVLSWIDNILIIIFGIYYIIKAIKSKIDMLLKIGFAITSIFTTQVVLILCMDLVEKIIMLFK